MSEETGQPLASVALRGGGIADVYVDRIVVSEQTYTLSDLAAAGLIPDVSGPAGYGLPGPAVGLTLRDQKSVTLAPADPLDAWRLLDAIYQRRPDLRPPVPPVPPFAYAPPGYAPPGAGYPPPPYGYAPPGYAPPPGGWSAPRPNTNDTTLGGLSHLSILFGGFVVPLIIWLVSRENSPFAARHGKQAFFFQLGYTIIAVVAVLVGYGIFFSAFFNSALTYNPALGTQPSDTFITSYIIFLIMFVVLGIIHLIAIVFSVIGAVKAFQGQPYSYPLLGRL